MIYRLMYRCRRCGAVFDLGKINGMDAAEGAMTEALDREPEAKIMCEVFHDCSGKAVGIADLIGAERP